MKTAQGALFIAVFLVFSHVADSLVLFDTVVKRWTSLNCSFPEPSVYSSANSVLQPCKILTSNQSEAYPLCYFFYSTSLSMCTSDSKRKMLLTHESINESPFSKNNSTDNLICTSFALASKPNTSQNINTDVCQKLCLSNTHNELKPICRALAAAVCIFFGEEHCHFPEPEKVLQKKTTESAPPLPASESEKTAAPVDSKTEADLTSNEVTTAKTPSEAAKPSNKQGAVNKTPQSPSGTDDVPLDSDIKEEITTTKIDVGDGKKGDPVPDKTTPGYSDDVTTTPKPDAGEIDPDKTKTTSKPSDKSEVQKQNNEKTVEPSPSYVVLEGNKNQNKTEEKPGSPSSNGDEPEGSKVEGNKSSGKTEPSSLNDKSHENKNENPAEEAEPTDENDLFSSTDLPRENENSKDDGMRINEVEGENKDDDKVSIKAKVNKIADDNKATNIEEEESGSGHFLAYFLTAVIICVSGYIVYHNKQKIMAFIIEGRGGSRGRQRSKGVKYTELKSNVEEVLPSLEKTATVKHFVY